MQCLGWGVQGRVSSAHTERGDTTGRSRDRYPLGGPAGSPGTAETPQGQRVPPPSACLQTRSAGPAERGCPSSSGRRPRAGGHRPGPGRRAAAGGTSSGPAPRPRPPVCEERRREGGGGRRGEPRRGLAAYLAVHHSVLPVQDRLPRGGQHQAPLPHRSRGPTPPPQPPNSNQAD